MGKTESTNGIDCARLKNPVLVPGWRKVQTKSVVFAYDGNPGTINYDKAVMTKFSGESS
jgi:hypothetical protein